VSAVLAAPDLMDEHTLLVLIAIFVFVSAVALAIQAGCLLGVYKAVREMQKQTARVIPKVESLVITSQAAVEDSRKQLAEITSRTNTILDTTQKQLDTMEGFLNDAVSRAKVQMERVEMVVDDTLDRAQSTVHLVHGTILTPLRQIHGLAEGLKAALTYFMRGNRPSPDRATVDEEMFI
jgi:flagellar biosynthesis protein FliQ